MALLHHRLPIIAVILLVSLSATATARPCRSFIISSYSFRNPSSNTFATITEIRSLTPLYINDKPYDIFFEPIHRENLHQQIDFQGASIPRAPLGFSTDFTSLRDRTKDILSVALALLFGVGCGALTAATMYFIWSMFTARFESDHDPVPYGAFPYGDEIPSPKKMGYEKIPSAEAADAKAPPAKDSV